jgi:phage tail sheath protein FI
MPVQLSYPGVYIEELPSGVRTITSVSTALTAFIGAARRGPANDPVRVQSFAEFERVFGGLSIDSTLGHAVAHFYLNGGADALIVRVACAGTAARADVGGLKLVAAEAGQKGNNLRTTVADAGSGDPNQFKLSIEDTGTATTTHFDDQTIAGIEAALAAAPVRLDPDAPAPAARPTNAGPVSFADGKDAAAPATLTRDSYQFAAASPGAWGDKLLLRVEHPAAAGTLFNLAIRDAGSETSERFLNLSADPASPRFVALVLEQQSKLVKLTGIVPATRPNKHPDLAPGKDPWSVADGFASTFANGADGAAISDDEISHPNLQSQKRGLWALEHADLFNLLCIPPLAEGDIGAQTRTQAAQYCALRRAFYIVDPLQAWNEPSDVTGATGLDGPEFGLARSENAALFFPYLRAPDPLRENQIVSFAPCGAVAGVMARTDATRGVWKAPAGIEASINGAVALDVKLTDGENGQLNPLGVNCLRSFPVIGRVVWGARTLAGADQLASQWKYVPVRRLALFIEESLFRGTKWVVFEPNDEPLWAQVRLNIGAFMHTLFRQGAFQGTTPRDAYFVQCSDETTTQTDIANGIVNIVVGFAPLKPAEFVVLKIQQIAPQP